MKITKTQLRQIIKEEIQKHRLDEKHPKIPDLDRYIELTDPDFDTDDWGDADSEISQIEKNAKQKGLYDELMRASTIAHFGRGVADHHAWYGSGWDNLKHRAGWIKSVKNRITKDNKLNKNSSKWLKNQIKRARR